MQALELKFPPVAQFTGAAALMWAIAVLAPLGDFRFPGQLLLASVLLLLAGLVGLAAVRAFARAETSVNPLRPDAASRLVTHGIYRYTRNPMYLSLLLALLAWGAWLGNTLALLVLPAFMWLVHRLQIRPEERALAVMFGAEYAAYAARVRRWL